MPTFRQHNSNSVPTRYNHGEPIYELLKKGVKDIPPDRYNVRGSLEQICSYFAGGEICPVCKMPFDKGKKRKLVDQCGHEKCYSCLFKSDKCLICTLQAPAKRTHQLVPRIPFSIGRSKLKTNGTFFSQKQSNQDPGLPPEHPTARSLLSAFTPRRQTHPSLASIASQFVQKSGRRTPLSDLSKSDSNSTLNCDSKSFDSDRLTDSDDLYMSISALKPPIPRPTLHKNKPNMTTSCTSFSSLSTFSSEANTSSSNTSPSATLPGQQLIQKCMDVNLKPLFFEVPQEDPNPFFVGRTWLFNDIQAKLRSESQNQGVIIAGQMGSGKTAAILQIVDYSCFGRKREERMYQDIYARTDPQGTVDFIPEGVWPLSQMLVAYHFCQADNAITCHVPEFVHSLAAQLCQAPQIFAYRDFYLSNPHIQDLLSMSSCIKDPENSFVKGILEPLQSLRRIGKIPSEPLAILIDGLCEAEYHNPEYGGSIAHFISQHISKMPPFLKLIVTVRTEFLEVTRSLPFHAISLDPNIEGVISDPPIRDLIDYVTFRCSHSPTIQNNVGVQNKNDHGSCMQKFIKHIVYLSRGSILYLKLLIDLIERGHLVVKSGSFKVIPQALSEIFLLLFNLKFSSVESFEKVKPILNVCLATLTPLTLVEIFHSVNSCLLYQFLSWEEFLIRFKVLGSFLIKRLDDTYMIFHPAFKEWLCRRTDAESDKFLCEPRQGHACIALRLSRMEWPLDSEKSLALGHHILKAHLYKNAPTDSRITSRDLQGMWVAKSCYDLSEALTHEKNMYSPNLKVSRLLLIAGASPNYPQESPILTVCAGLGYTEMVSLLIEFEADVNIKDNCGKTAIIKAATAGHCDVVNLLYKSGADLSIVDACGEGVLVHAARSGHLNVVAYLLSCDWNLPTEKLERIAAQALVGATSEGHLNIVEYLLEMADLSADLTDKITGHSPLTMACSSGQTKVVSYLILMGANVNKPNNSEALPITCATKQGSYEIIELLLKEGIPIDSSDSSGSTPLMIASREGLLAIMELLFSHGASLIKSNIDGQTAFDQACLHGQIHAVQYLADRGADLNHLDKMGRTPLDLAASQGDPSVVQYLLDHGAIIEHVDVNGLRPLDKAVGAGNVSAIQCFLKRGAKLGPSTWAMASGKSHITIMLLNKLQEDGVTLCKRGKIKEASHRFSYALRKIPTSDAENNTVFSQLKLHLLLNLSRCKRKLKEINDAVKLAEQAIDLRPDSYEAFYARARANKEAGNSRQAMQDITTALTLVPPSVKGIRQALIRIREEMITDAEN